ncbi:hypothetical protein GCM10022393_36600 [Aquimarina addita]|uniref:MoxR-vWA-beta-propeller ternary system domain-containing protein n=1 Tax=Aquimarina addita TaxID=870485 RepID=A0ABP6URZ7_9FLAO
MNPVYYLYIKKVYKNDLGKIRHWDTLTVAFDQGDIWVRGFDEVQINSIEIKGIPYKSLFYEKDGKLYLLHSQLPDQHIPSVLWTPIDRALPIELPAYNHNYFGSKEAINMQLIPSENERETAAVICAVDSLQQYIETAPAIRLKKLMWVLLNNNDVLIIGTPVLPITGTAYWRHYDFLIPAGYDFDLSIFTEMLHQKMNVTKDTYVIWNTNNTWFSVLKEVLQPLTRGSFRMTLNRFSEL